MRTLAALMMFLAITAPRISRGDLFGGDIAVLTQILVQTIAQLQQLEKLAGTASEFGDLMRQINDSVSGSIGLLEAIKQTGDPGLYKDWNRVADALLRLRSIYGSTIDSPEKRVQSDTDQGIAEAISLNNHLYDYAKGLDELSLKIKNTAQSSSPPNAQVLTAQSMGFVLSALSQNVKAQASQLKLQAQMLALQNRREKEYTKYSKETTDSIRSEMKRRRPFFQYPKF